MMETFRGLLHSMVQGQQDAGSNGTRRYATSPPAVRIPPEKLGEKATAKITKSAMALEIEEFIKEASKGKTGFQTSLIITPAEKQEFTVIVCCSWDEAEPMEAEKERPKTVAAVSPWSPIPEVAAAS